MRRDLLRSTLAVVALALLLFAVPLALASSRQLRDQALDELEGSVQQVALFVDQRARTCGELQLILRLGVAQGSGEGSSQLALYDRQGQLALDLTPSASAPPPQSDVTVAATEGRVGRAHAGGQLHVTVPLASSVCGTQLLLRGSSDDTGLVAARRRSLLGIGLGAIAVLGVAAAAANVLGRRLARPFEQLASSARTLGDGDFTGRAPRSGLPEADAISDALDATAERLGRALERGNAFTTDVAHQLRTPLTALSLDLEVLEAQRDNSGALESARAEVERLTATIDELVTLTRPEVSATPIDPAGLVAERLPTWQANAAVSDRQVVVEPATVPPVLARRAAVTQALDVLVDNALEHGTGNVNVALSIVAGPAPDPGPEAYGVRIAIRDDGPRDPEQLPVPGRGRGLALARSLIEAEGGRLVLDTSPSGTVATLLLRAAAD